MKIKEKRSVKANNFFSQKSYYKKQRHPLPPVVFTGTISKRASLTYHFILFYKRLNYDLHFVFPLLPFLFYWTILIIFAFAFHAKSFAILFLVFFLFFLPVTFSERFIKSYQESMWSRSDSLLGHTQNSFLKLLFVTLVAHDTGHAR